MLIDIIAGARPNFMKIAPIIRALQKDKTRLVEIEYRLIHTGQHYDYEMSTSFFEQLDIPLPNINLGAGAGTQAKQTAEIMIGYEALLKEKKADVCLVVGDVNSTLACALVAKKEGLFLAHVEGGLRSYDMSMPEEINRLVTDSISDWYFTTSIAANNNLLKSGVDAGRIFFVGNTMIDTLLENINRIRRPDFWNKHSLETNSYFILTLHRPTNVDDVKNLQNILQEISIAARDCKVIFPAHPRVIPLLNEVIDLPRNIILVSPQPYLQFIYLVKYSLAVITDSGGITEETTVLGIPCMTLRDNTERPETVDIGTNELLGTDLGAIQPSFNKLFDKQWKCGKVPEKWDGKAGERIVDIFRRHFSY